MNAFIEKAVVKWDGSGNETAGSLLQIYHDGGYSVDWTTTTSQPILKLSVATSTGGHVAISSASFTYDGAALNFSGTTVTLSGQTWTKDSTGKFAFLHYTDSDSVDYVLLRVIDNLADADNLTNTQIGYTLSFEDSEVGSGSLSGTEDVQLFDGGGNSYVVNIQSTDTTFNSETESVTLTAVAYRGLEVLTIGDGTYQVVWFKNATTYMGVGESLTLDVDDVDSTAVFTAYLTDDATSVGSSGAGSWDKLASDTIRVTDTTDPYRLVDSYKYGGAVSSSQSETLTVSVYTGDTQVTDGTFAWTWSILNCVLEETNSGTGSGSTLSVPITYSDCAYENTTTVDGVTDTVSGYGGVTVSVGLTLTI